MADNKTSSPVSKLKRFVSGLDTQAAKFHKNTKEMKTLVAELWQRLQEWDSEGEERRKKEHTSRGKLLGRQRLQLVLDEDSPFLEIAPLAGQGLEGVAQGNPLIGGIGLISGIECMIVAYAPTVGRGALNLVTGRKFNRFMEISMQNHLPFVQLLESSGADLTVAFDVFHAKPGPFYSLARMSQQRIPSIAVVFGTCIAGGAYLAGMSDHVIMVQGSAQLALAGSKLVQVATGEIATEEQLGGAALHSRISGSSEYMAGSEYEAILKTRELVATFSPAKGTEFPGAFLSACEEPVYDPEELLGIVSGDGTHPNFDCREVMARIVDGSKLFEYKPEYGPTLVTCWANIFGVPVGILGNNGVIFPASAQKGAHFINLCNQRGCPIIFLHNVTGFIVGEKYEKDGMLKWGAQMINAMSNSTVPNISILIGSSFGAANYAMCGVGYYPRFIFSWPNSKCAVMGPNQLSGVMELLAREGAAKLGKKPDEEKLKFQTLLLKQNIETTMDAFYCTTRNIDDGVIDPRDTRRVLGMCLSAVCQPKIESSFSVGLARL